MTLREERDRAFVMMARACEASMDDDAGVRSGDQAGGSAAFAASWWGARRIFEPEPSRAGTPSDPLLEDAMSSREALLREERLNEGATQTREP
jgi:hypothetical protein